MDTRRDFLKRSGILALAGLAAPLIPNFGSRAFSNPTNSLNNEFSLPPLPYSYDALEPHIDKMTMEIHHTKHHQAYIANLNKALASSGNTGAKIDELIQNISRYEMVIRNNAGGHWNHSFFWKILKPGGGTVNGKILELVNSAFGSFDQFKTAFSDAAMKRFGSGWAWLIVDQNKKLVIVSTPNQDNPLMDVSEIKGIPVLGIDVWEHAYYLKYQNKRADYVSAWWNVINWDEVNSNLALALKM
jgi:superoxide dismutase, Fe-Mn family